MDQATIAGTTPAPPAFHDFGSIPFAGRPDALFERHLLSDAVVEPSGAYDQQRFEALARSVRDLLARRWIKTQRTYDQQNPKRIHYLSMEFLMGRSLRTTSRTSAASRPSCTACPRRALDWSGRGEENPNAGLGNGGLGRLAACFLDSMATLELPAMGYGLRYEYGIFRQSIEDGWQRRAAGQLAARQDPWEIVPPQRGRGGHARLHLRDAPGQRADHCQSSIDPASAFPMTGRCVGFGGKTINTLRLWGAAARDYFDFQDFSTATSSARLTGSIAAETLTRVLYPNDSTAVGQGLRLPQEYFLVACSLADSCVASAAAITTGHLLPDKVAIQLNDTHPAWRCRS